jgi:hypothetical protein
MYDCIAIFSAYLSFSLFCGRVPLDTSGRSSSPCLTSFSNLMYSVFRSSTVFCLFTCSRRICRPHCSAASAKTFQSHTERFPLFRPMYDCIAIFSAYLSILIVLRPRSAARHIWPPEPVHPVPLLSPTYCRLLAYVLCFPLLSGRSMPLYILSAYLSFPFLFGCECPRSTDDMTEPPSHFFLHPTTLSPSL